MMGTKNQVATSSFTFELGLSRLGILLLTQQLPHLMSEKHDEIRIGILACIFPAYVCDICKL